MESELESLPPLPEDFQDELPPLPESFSEEAPETRRRPRGLWFMIALFGFTVYNGVSIWQAHREKNDALALTQQNAEAAAKANGNTAHNRKRIADIHTYAPGAARLRQHIDHCTKVLAETDKSIRENSGSEAIEKLQAEEAELLSRKNELLEKKQELEAKLK